MKLGVDIVSIKRFRKIEQPDYKDWARVFTEREWRYAFRGKKSAQRLAGIFAAKEAAMKAVGAAGIAQFLNWEVRHDHNKEGRPILVRSGSKRISRRHCGKNLLSVSHDSNMAIAAVLIL